ncbi:glutathione peroxidase [Neisseria arctica]|uniref:Glutathione peroxidase n=1 Tax=Neisseria arctica TaxID=1470200 RepID=A0A0J1C183_9NEIS|nr:glutathione peroxidase [Neisseria arctica]KLT72023.1 glutathione peroxidase [Neisseria arctica]UOO86341.1 glutathione peroxidase [Neisseria arctica]
MKQLYSFSAQDSSGQTINMTDYEDKVLLIVNTATRCGLTPQYQELQALYNRYADQGFEILDFPCNQFRTQAPEASGEIAQICQTKFGTKFKIFDKVEVNGTNTHPIYRYLKSQKPHDKGGLKFKDLLLKLAALGTKQENGDIKWNFTKFLVNRKGEVIERFAPSMPPSEIAPYIEALL